MMLFKKHPDQNQPNKNILTLPQEFVCDLFWGGGCGSSGVGRAGGLIVLGEMGRDVGGLTMHPQSCLWGYLTLSLVSPKTGKLRQPTPLRVRTGPQ